MNEPILTITDCQSISRRVTLYGDESSARELITYCLLVVPTEENSNIEQRFLHIYRKYGGSPKARFHCREMFSMQARLKTEWSHLNERGSWLFARELAILIRLTRIKASVCVVHKDTYPKEMPDGKGKSFEVKAETCYAFGFYAAAQGLVANKIIDKQDKCGLFVDEQNTRFNLFGL
jgi:hypothetical protein